MPDPDLAQTAVVLVDDDERWLRTFARVVGTVGVRSVTTTAAPEGVDALVATHAPCVVLSDLEMHGDRLAGAAVAAAVRARGVPVAVVSALLDLPRDERLAGVPFLCKADVSHASVGALLGDLVRRRGPTQRPKGRSPRR